MKSDSVILLHISIISPMDLGRLQRELYNLDISLQAKSANQTKPLRISPQLDNLIKSSGIDLNSIEDRKLLTQQLQAVRRTAPVVNMAFASTPDEASLSKILKWFREFGHPNTLIDISVNPHLGGGCVLKTATKTFDLSYSNKFKQTPLKLTN